MLSSLPTELIREIIESTVPHSFHSTTYHERQDTLRSLSLVSKVFQSIAQPLLVEIVWIKSARDLFGFPFPRPGGGVGPGSGDILRDSTVVFTPRDYQYFLTNGRAVADSLRRFSSVRSFTISVPPEEHQRLYRTTTDLSLLSSFQSIFSVPRAPPQQS